MGDCVGDLEAIVTMVLVVGPKVVVSPEVPSPIPGCSIIRTASQVMQEIPLKLAVWLAVQRELLRRRAKT